jgi:putative spermidine/putrescine transport system permease protein
MDELTATTTIRKGQRFDDIVLLLTPMTLLDLTLFAIPIIVFARYGFSSYVSGHSLVEDWTLGSAANVLNSKFYTSIIVRTLITALVASLLTLLLSLPSALAVRRLKTKTRGIITSLLMYPFMVGGVIRSLGWVALLRESGPLNTVLKDLHLIQAPLKILNTNSAVILGIVSIELPLLIIIISASLESIDPSIEQASLNLGASEFTTVMRVLVPLALPGIGAGTILVFIQSMNTYVSSRLLGGPTLPMLSTQIYDELTSNMNWPRGAVLSIILVSLIIVVTLISSRIFAPRHLRRNQ